VALLSACAEDRPRPLALATGTTAGVYYPLGGAMASRWTRDLSGIVVKAEVSAGSVTNLIQVAKGESDIGVEARPGPLRSLPRRSLSRCSTRTSRSPTRS